MLLSTLANLLILAVLIYIAIVLTKFQNILNDKEEIEKNILTRLWRKVIGHNTKEKEDNFTDFSDGGYRPFS